MSDSIVKVKKNSNGEITDYVLRSGKTVSHFIYNVYLLWFWLYLRCIGIYYFV